jgi:hypothetical protein
MSGALPERDFGEKGVAVKFFQDGKWQAGRAWSCGPKGVNGRCRDWDSGGRAPLETHGTWPPEEVRGLEKHLKATQLAML